jgi:TatD DNase family protein
MLWMIADGHCHLHNAPELIDEVAGASHVTRLVVNGTCPSDWPTVLSLRDAHPDTVLPQLGLHPWRVPDTLEDLAPILSELRARLEQHPGAGLGECGLDKSGRRADNYSVQIQAFKEQVAMALALRRPLSVHCVHSSSHVYSEVKTVGGRVPVLLHGWSESAEMTSMFARLENVYFSVNLTLLNRNARAKAVATVRAIPMDRLVLESDTPDGRLRNRENWVDWFRECGAHTVADALDKDVETALRRSTPLNVELMGHAVGAATCQPADAVLAQSAANIQRIFAPYNE